MEDRPLFGRLLETFVYQELRRQASWHEETVSFSHFHDKDTAEFMEKELGWTSVLAYNHEDFGPASPHGPRRQSVARRKTPPYSYTYSYTQIS